MDTGGDTRGTACKKWPASCVPFSSIRYGQSQKQSPWAWRMKALTWKAFLMLLEQSNCGERKMFSRTNYQINKKQIPKKLQWAEALSQSKFAGFFCYPQPNEYWFLSYLNTLNGLARRWLWHLLLTCVYTFTKVIFKSLFLQGDALWHSRTAFSPLQEAPAIYKYIQLSSKLERAAFFHPACSLYLASTGPGISFSFPFSTVSNHCLDRVTGWGMEGYC